MCCGPTKNTRINYDRCRSVPYNRKCLRAVRVSINKIIIKKKGIAYIKPRKNMIHIWKSEQHFVDDYYARLFVDFSFMQRKFAIILPLNEQLNQGNYECVCVCVCMRAVHSCRRHNTTHSSDYNAGAISLLDCGTLDMRSTITVCSAQKTKLLARLWVYPVVSKYTVNWSILCVCNTGLSSWKLLKTNRKLLVQYFCYWLRILLYFL